MGLDTLVAKVTETLTHIDAFLARVTVTLGKVDAYLTRVEEPDEEEPPPDEEEPPPDEEEPPPDEEEPPPPPGTVARPTASLGTGCFVVGNKLYDGNGKLFRMAGTNKTHQDIWSPALGLTGSNATRWIAFQEPWIPYTTQGFINAMKNANIGGSIHNKCIQIPGFWDGTCESDAGSFETMVSRWESGAPLFQAQCERWMILNIANEWGSDETLWRNAYVSAIQRIRAAGWHGCIMVDAPGCGQNGMAIARHGAAILAADPEKNVCFSWHIYGNVWDSGDGVAREWRSAEMDLVPCLDALAATGLCVVIGEFGPGRGNIGGSPTRLRPERIIQLAEARGFGWLSWSWDDNNLADIKADDNGFSHLYDHNLNQLGTNLTQFGALIVQHWNKPKATVF